MASLQTTPEVAARPTSKQLSKLSEAEVGAAAAAPSGPPLHARWQRRQASGHNRPPYSAAALHGVRGASPAPAALPPRPHAPAPIPCHPSQVAAVWRDYFVFTITRDPLDRAVSQYSFLMRSNLADPPGCAAAVSWPGGTGGPAAGAAPALRPASPAVLPLPRLWCCCAAE